MGSELDRVLHLVMSPPRIETEPGFRARILVSPGELYDPFAMRSRGHEVWVSDDGGQIGDKGGQILAIDPEGRVAPVVALGRIAPVVGFDIASSSFGGFEGQIFALSLPGVGRAGDEGNSIVQRIDPATDEVEVFSTLPPANGVIASAGCDARFGPDGTPFAGRFFSATVRNRTVYQMTPDGESTAFVTFDEEWGHPFGLEFSQDGAYLLVSTSAPGSGSIAKVSAGGILDPDPLFRRKGLNPTGIAYAPPSFGRYAGDLFIASTGPGAWEERPTHGSPEVSHVYRLTADGELMPFASRFRMPIGMHFTGERMLVCDIGGDFIMGGRELPDGFVVEVVAE